MLEFSFNSSVVNHPIMQRLFIATLEHCNQMIDEAMASIKVCDEATMRDRLSLDSTPFVLAKRMRMNFNEITKDNDIRLCFQALLLYLLRRKIPPKCKYCYIVIKIIFYCDKPVESNYYRFFSLL